jgi:hypothetical protein
MDDTRGLWTLGTLFSLHDIGLRMRERPRPLSW